MSITNSLAVALALTMLWNTPGHAQCASDPAKVAKTFYTQHHDFYLEDPKAVSALVAPRLLMSLKLEHACPQGELCAIEAVPWIGLLPISQTPRLGVMMKPEVVHGNEKSIH